MTHCVDPTVHGVKAPEAQSSVDRVFPETKLNQLPTANDTMLPPSELRDRRVRPVSLQFPAYMAGQCRLGGHGTTVSCPTSRVVRSV